MTPDDQKLSALVRGARANPALPPRFQEHVWSRIEDAEAPEKPASWLDAVAALILRPRFAYATATVLLLAGLMLGAHQGTQVARHDAQQRYLAAVAPLSVR